MKMSALWVLHSRGGKAMCIMVWSLGSWVGGKAEIQGEANLNN